MKIYKIIVLLASMLFAQIVFAEDVEVVIDRDSGQKVLNAMDFPLELFFQGIASDLESELGSLGDATVSDDIEVEDIDTEIKGLITTFGDDVEDAFISAVSDYKSGLLVDDQLSDKEVEILNNIVNSLGDDNTYSSIKAQLLNANDEVIEESLQELFKLVDTKFEILHVNVRIEKPTLQLSSPIVLSNLLLHVKARVKACIKIFRWVCISDETPWIRIEGQHAYLDLSSSGPKVVGMPRFQNLDIVIVIKVLKWYVRIPIGVTGIVNNELRKRGPVDIADLSSFEQNVPYSSKKIKISDISISGSSGDLAIKSQLLIE